MTKKASGSYKPDTFKPNSFLLEQLKKEDWEEQAKSMFTCKTATEMQK